MNAAPAITVLMPVHNAAPFVRAAIDSILTQSWTEFEFLIIDDGSSDDSLAVIKGIADPRIRLVEQKPNQGIVSTLNSGLALARGRYIARMDADDLALPGRLEQQFNFMESHPEVGLCGTYFQKIGDDPGPGWIRFHENASLQIALLFENPFCHPTVMMRREILSRHQLLYPADAPHAEEYALWARLARHTHFANLPDTLLHYRTHARQVSRLHNAIQCRSIDHVIRTQLAHLGLLRLSSGQLALHQVLGGGFYPLPGYIAHLKKWTRTLVVANARTGLFDHAELTRQLEERLRVARDYHERMLAEMPPVRRLKWRISTWLRHHADSLRPRAEATPLASP
ncbi:glycosyltransferase family 2 protein [Rariglobus hedericola]|uniref:Glycosyltransferase n=1 Tax=Rariglobus hedericola TaxID=2597822 RepID=A0A556QPW8_9BACT|nr:glycosyltransferase [Rariglobus hedericola]TSJ78685.1 glycosyltransferase [Rariglobus hedericola]